MAHSQLDLFLSPAVGGLAPTHPVSADGGGSLLSKAERHKARCKSYYEANKKRIIAKHTQWVIKNREKVKGYKCKWEKSNKAKIAIRSKQYAATNPEKVKAQRKASYEANKEKIKAYRNANKEISKAYQKQWREKNKAYKYACDLEWRQNNIEKQRGYARKYANANRDKAQSLHAKKYSTDTHYKLKIILRSRFRMAVLNNSKTGSAVRDLGCTIPEFKAYIQSKFADGMTWENHGVKGWHLDHVIPLAAFDLTDRDQLLRACHFTNYQPLWWRDNLIKWKKHQPEGVSCQHQQLS